MPDRAHSPLWLPMFMAVALSLSGSTPAQAQNNVRKELRQVAAALTDEVKIQGGDSISVGHFTGRRVLKSGSGPGFALILQQELEACGMKISPTSMFEAKGDYQEQLDEETKLLAISLTTRLLKKNKALKEWESQIHGETEAATAFGLTIGLEPTASLPERSKEIEKGIKEPPVPYIKDAFVSHAESSPFGMTIVVKQPDGSFAPVKAELKDNLAFTPLKRDDKYRVRLFNRAEYAVGVTLTIDGLNVFVFHEFRTPDGKPLPVFPELVIEPKSQVDIPGWLINPKRIDPFQLVSYPDAATLPLADDPGVITARFVPCWKKDEKPPLIVPPGRRSMSRTGRGSPEAAKLELVERVFGDFLCSISVRYQR